MKARFVRILVYEGEIDWIQDCIERRAVKGTYKLPNGAWIKEAVLGDYLELLPELPAGVTT